jgi:macrolide-specific efflux system membrane fusion protein
MRSEKLVFMPMAAVLLSIVLAAAKSPAAEPPAEAKVEQCTIAIIDEAEVPAQEPGVLEKVLVKEGQQVTAGELLAKIDDAKPQMELRVAQAKLDVAKEKASDDVNIRYATASEMVADANYRISDEANKKVPGAVPAMVLRELLLEVKKASLGIEQAQMEKRIAGFEAKVSKAESDAAEENINRHQIKSPLSGVVVKLHSHEGQWVQPGDHVVHVIRIDRLKVEGFISAGKFSTAALRDRDASVSVALPGGPPRSFSGKVVFVDPEVQGGDNRRVTVEVQNVEENGSWLLSPGLPAEITIPLR